MFFLQSDTNPIMSFLSSYWWILILLFIIFSGLFSVNQGYIGVVTMFGKYQRIMQHVGSRLAWLGGLGDDCVPAYFAIGVQAYTSSISNIAPKLSLELAEAAMTGAAWWS